MKIGRPASAVPGANPAAAALTKYPPLAIGVMRYVPFESVSVHQAAGCEDPCELTSVAQTLAPWTGSLSGVFTVPESELPLEAARAGPMAAARAGTDAGAIW